MVSRKKAAGKARKAAKAKAREEEQEKERVTTQLQKLPCTHGADPNSLEICFQFVRAFMRKVRDVRNSDLPLLHTLLDAEVAMIDEFSDEWKDSAKMELVLSLFLSFGTQNYLDGNHRDSRYYATVARYFEQHITVKLKQSQAKQNWPKLNEISVSDLHTLVKFFRHRIPCSCLDEKYEEVKSITKVGFCYNAECKFCFNLKGEGMERSKTKYCSQCRCVTYCSRECQVACWTDHKPLCEKYILRFQ